MNVHLVEYSSWYLLHGHAVVVTFIVLKSFISGDDRMLKILDPPPSPSFRLIKTIYNHPMPFLTKLHLTFSRSSCHIASHHLG